VPAAAPPAAPISSDDDESIVMRLEFDEPLYPPSLT